jgi:hypothetical protein
MDINRRSIRQPLNLQIESPISYYLDPLLSHDTHFAPIDVVSTFDNHEFDSRLTSTLFAFQTFSRLRFRIV